MRIRTLILSAALWLVPAPAESQFSGMEGSTVKGQIEARWTRGLTVQLYETSRHETLTTSDIKTDGAFEFRGAPSGSYLITVINARGQEVYRGSANLGGQGMQPLVIRLSEVEAPQPVSGSVSVNQLQHTPSRKAFDAVLQAQRLSEAGDFSKAAALLEKAVALSPDYADAHTNLGAQYLRLGRYEESIAESERAIALDGANPMLLCNVAFAQIHLGKDASALESARAALRLKQGDANAQYIIGLVLFFHHGPADEVRRLMEAAARTVPAARVALEKIAAGTLVPR